MPTPDRPASGPRGRRRRPRRCRPSAAGRSGRSAPVPPGAGPRRRRSCARHWGPRTAARPARGRPSARRATCCGSSPAARRAPRWSTRPRARPPWAPPPVWGRRRWSPSRLRPVRPPAASGGGSVAVGPPLRCLRPRVTAPSVGRGPPGSDDVGNASGAVPLVRAASRGSDRRERTTMRRGRPPSRLREPPPERAPHRTTRRPPRRCARGGRAGPARRRASGRRPAR